LTTKPVLPQVLQHWRPRGDGLRLMLAVRLVFGFLLAAGLVCLAMYVGTGNKRWRDLGLRIVKWAVVAALGFFAVLIIQRLAPMH